jgi:hypothetical protein
MINRKTEQNDNGISEEERLQILEEKKEDTKLTHLIKTAVNECINNDKNDPVTQVISEQRIRKIERDVINFQTELVSIQEESLRLARRTLDITRIIDKLEKELDTVDFKLDSINKGTDELKTQAFNTAQELKDLAFGRAEDLKQLAEDKAEDLKDVATHRADDLREDEVIGWNRRQQTVATIITVIAVVFGAIATIKSFYS